MNVKPQLTEMARKAINAVAERSNKGGSHPDGSVTWENCQVIRETEIAVLLKQLQDSKGHILAFVVDLDSIAERGGAKGQPGTGKPCTSKEGTVQGGPNAGQVRGGNLMLATLNGPLPKLHLGVLDGDFDVRANLNLTIQPRKA